MEAIIMGSLLIGSGLVAIKKFENTFERSIAGFIALLGIAIFIN